MRTRKATPVTHRSIIHAAVAASLAALAGLAATTLRADDAWIVRSVAPGLTSPNDLDVLVAPGGNVLVGYATPAQSGQGGNVVLACLASGQESFTAQTDVGGGDAASFAIDRFGNVYYAARDSLHSDVRVGADLGLFGGMTSSVLPGSGAFLASAVPTLAVNGNGLPVIAEINQSGAVSLSTFNVAQASWQTTTPLGLGLNSPAGPNCQSLTFDTGNNPALGYVQPSGSGAGTLVVARQSPSGWTNVAAGTALAQYGVSVAAAPNGSIGFAYVNAAGALCFNSDGNCAGQRANHQQRAEFSHAVQPGVRFPGKPGHRVQRLFRGAEPGPADSQGAWTDEVLPVSSQRASVAFDAAGEPLVAAATPGGIALLGIDLAVHWNGSGANANWSSTGNWSGGVPANGTSLTLGAATGANVVANNDLVGKSFSGIPFASDAAGYTIGGNAITLSGAIVNQGSNNQTLNLPVTLAAGAGVVDAGSGAITIGGNLSGSAGLTETGSGAVILSGTDTYNGGTTVSGGTLAVTAASALPSSGSVMIRGGARMVLGGGAGIGAAFGLAVDRRGQRRLERRGDAGGDDRAECGRGGKRGDNRRRGEFIAGRRRGGRARAGDACPVDRRIALRSLPVAGQAFGTARVGWAERSESRQNGAGPCMVGLASLDPPYTEPFHPRPFAAAAPNNSSNRRRTSRVAAAHSCNSASLSACIKCASLFNSVASCGSVSRAVEFISRKRPSIVRKKR